MTNKDGVLRKIKHVEFQKRMKNLDWNTKASQIKDNDLDKRGFWFKQVVYIITCHVHINAVRIGPGMLEVLLQSLSQRIGNLVESDELLNPQHVDMIP